VEEYRAESLEVLGIGEQLDLDDRAVDDRERERDPRCAALGPDEPDVRVGNLSGHYI
jgi:hypothetical protein